MTELFLEDLHLGDRFDSPTIQVTEEEIVEFAQDFDPQPFHLDLDAGQTERLPGSGR